MLIKSVNNNNNKKINDGIFLLNTVKRNSESTLDISILSYNLESNDLWSSGDRYHLATDIICDMSLIGDDCFFFYNQSCNKVGHYLIILFVTKIWKLYLVIYLYPKCSFFVFLLFLINFLCPILILISWYFFLLPSALK